MINLSVLLLDDDEDICTLFRLFMATLDVRACRVSPNVEGFLTAFALDPPDVAFVDIRLDHGINGLDVIEPLMPEYPDTDFVIISGWGDVEDRLRINAINALFMPKPLSKEALADQLNAIALRKHCT